MSLTNTIFVGIVRITALVCAALVSSAQPICAQTADVTVRIDGPSYSSCTGNTDFAVPDGWITLVFSARSTTLQDGATLGFVLYSPDGSLDSVDISEVTMLNKWATTEYWTLGGGIVDTDLDGQLPEQWLTGGGALPGDGFLEPDFVDFLKVRFYAPAISGGPFDVICVDSAFFPPAGNWLFSPGAANWYGGSGDLAVGGSSASAFCMETATGLPALTSRGLCDGASVMGEACDPIYFSSDDTTETINGYSHTGAGTLEFDGVSSFTYYPDPSDVGAQVEVVLDMTCQFVDVCGNLYQMSHQSVVDIVATIPCTNCCDTPGDADHNGSLNIADATFGIAYIFAGGPAPICINEASADGDNAFNIADISYLIAYIFAGGPAPVCGSFGS